MLSRSLSDCKSLLLNLNLNLKRCLRDSVSVSVAIVVIVVIVVAEIKSLSDSLTMSPIELSWTAKKT